MVHNVEQILSRGERIELLVDKTDNLSGQAWAFRRGARDVRRKQFWKNQRILLLSGFVGLVSLPVNFRQILTEDRMTTVPQVLIYVIVAGFCGVGLNHCGK